MSPDDILPTIAEMAITVAGFTGIIVSIRPERVGSWGTEELIRVLGTIAVCLVAAFCAVLPFAFSSFATEPHLQWGVPLVVSGSTSLAILAVLLHRIVGAGFRFIAPWVTWPGMAIMIGLSILSLALGFGLIVPFSAGILVLQLGWSLTFSVVTLVATLAITFRDSGTGA